MPKIVTVAPVMICMLVSGCLDTELPLVRDDGARQVDKGWHMGDMQDALPADGPDAGAAQPDTGSESGAEPCTEGATKDCQTGLEGACARGLRTCTGGHYGTCTEIPGARMDQDACGDNIDNDCNGLIDDGPGCTSCKPGEKKACATGKDGICASGYHSCENGFWLATCQPDHEPRIEQCSNGTDDDCDGQTDRADTDCHVCSDGSTNPCSTGKLGVCAAGTQLCTNGFWETTCTPKQLATIEACDNGLDDDCDGQTDRADTDCHDCVDGSTKPCSTGKPGICATGKHRCTAGAWETTCIPAQIAGIEDCNNTLDDDCDGQADRADTDCHECVDGATKPCSTGKLGVCAAGTQRCTAGFWETLCSANRAPSIEACGNGVDDDCDGQTDHSDTDCHECVDGATKPCNTGKYGICAAGTTRCVAGYWETTCTADKTAGTESCNNMLDDDCDGQTDSTDSDCIKCGPPNATQACTPQGCGTGERRCTLTDGAWEWSDCTPKGIAEVGCNGVDDDCDQQVDEGSVLSRIQNGEYINATWTAKLSGTTAPSFFFLRTAAFSRQLALWGGTNMIKLSTNATRDLNQIIQARVGFGGEKYRFLDSDMDNSAALTMLPSSFPGPGSGKRRLAVIAGDTLNVIQEGTYHFYAGKLSSIKDSSAVAVANGTVRAATFIPANANPKLNKDMVVFVTNSHCHLWVDEGGNGKVYTVTTQTCLCPYNSQNCPALGNVQAVSYHPSTPAGSHYLSVLAGDQHHLTQLLPDTGGPNMFKYTWTKNAANTFNCQR